MAKRKRKASLHYDRKVKRFRDAKGHFASYSRGIRSTVARKEYRAAPVQRRYVPKKKAVKKKIIKRVTYRLIPYNKLPEYGTGPVRAGSPRHIVRGQTMIFGLGRWGINSLASLIYWQIKRGYIRFRFWYKVVKSGFIYTETTKSGSKIGSTGPVTNSFVAYNGTFDEIVSFLLGRGNQINGKVIYYWISKRLG